MNATANLGLERAGAVIAEPGPDVDILDPLRPGRGEEHLAVDPTVPPLVLVLDVARVAPLHDGARQRVGPEPHVTR